VQEWPFAFTYAFFFLGALVRANATYWLGRGARRGGEHTGVRRRLDGPLVARAETVVARFGAPAVALSFLTVGVQTAVNLAAGVLRMPLWAYQAGAVVGALAWAGIYSTIGFAVFEAWVGGSPWWWILVAVAGIAVIVFATRWTRMRLIRTPPYAVPPTSAADREAERRGEGSC